ncbi:MAG: hypothetical protein Ta2B_11900 [Termitinemataceae bacterium]|nr:MAG: hypothetical protein Ta2B_11900 [Termitinemataceae bacterium]
MEIIVSDEKEVYASTPNCLKCKYFKVTWDNNFPRSCTVFNIKCRSLPSLEVFKATKQHCPSYEMKAELKHSYDT